MIHAFVVSVKTYLPHEANGLPRRIVQRSGRHPRRWAESAYTAWRYMRNHARLALRPAAPVPERRPLVDEDLDHGFQGAMVTPVGILPHLAEVARQAASTAMFTEQQATAMAAHQPAGAPPKQPVNCGIHIAERGGHQHSHAPRS
jgi:hypothetical protein